jgi:hypothetical protein
MGFHDGLDKGAASMQKIWCKSRKKCDGLSLVMRAGFSVMTPSQAKPSQLSSKWKSPNSPRLKKARQAKGEVKSTLIIFFGITGIFHIEFILAGKTVNSICYFDVSRQMCQNV